MSKRPERLQYTGRHGEYFVGVPARDLDETDIAALSDAQIADITANNPTTGKPLYREPAKRGDAPLERVAEAQKPDPTPDAKPE